MLRLDKRINGIDLSLPSISDADILMIYTMYNCSLLKVAHLYLIREEAEPQQEVLHQLEFVSHCVFLHLSPDLPGLLAHAVL